MFLLQLLHYGIQPWTFGFGLALSLAQLGPEAGARLDATAVFDSPLSLRGYESEDAAHPASHSRHPSVVARERLTQTLPHCSWRDEVTGLFPWLPFSFPSRRRAHVGGDEGRHFALRGFEQTQLKPIALVIAAQ